uniref:Uncharacterized protein n=1 Tax=Romanomermis culicivorax TaxID=13658 RepID=A0A915KCK2_ROMCU
MRIARLKDQRRPTFDLFTFTAIGKSTFLVQESSRSETVFTIYGLNLPQKNPMYGLDACFSIQIQ